jgi:hypothetical protein
MVNSRFGLSVLLLLGAGLTLRGQAPTIGDPPIVQNAPSYKKTPGVPAMHKVPTATTSAWYDTTNRTVIRDSWNLTFWPTTFVQTGWTGSVENNIPGTTTQEFKDAVLARVNWFRAMAGVPVGITLASDRNTKAQAAALMFSSNRDISHYPPTSWINYRPEGAEAAANSNICYGFTNDPGCVMAYMIDSGGGNTAVGHRRWILYPQTEVMGTGDVPWNGSYPYANALWVFDQAHWGARPATRDTFVAWPPPGYVPYQVVAPRWSFSYPGANFSNATITMQRAGQPVPVRLETIANGYGENTLVWIPDNLEPSYSYQPPAPASDTTTTVTITNVLVGETYQSFSYPVTLFDPSTGGSTFQFAPASASVSYAAVSGTANLTVSPANTSWTSSSNAAWLTITSGLSGTGSGPIGWSVSQNTSSAGRTGAITVSTATFSVIQGGMPCIFTLSSQSGNLPASGGSGSFTVTSVPADCAHGSYSFANWLTVTSSFDVPGVRRLTYSASANTSGAQRVGTITVAGQTFTVTQPAQPAQGAALQFVPVTPCRVMDTRGANGPLDGPFIAGTTTRTVPVPSSPCGIPTNAAAYSLNITVVPRVGFLGFLTVWPAGQPQPGASTLNSHDGSILANAAIVPAGTSGAINVYALHDTDLVIDINGYFVPPASGTLQFYPMAPCRVLDTRNSNGTFGGPAITGGTSRSFPIRASACGIPSNATAYAFNVTVVPRGFLGYLTAWPTGQPQPGASTLNSLDGTVLANAAIVPAGTGGAVSFYAMNTTDVVVDLNGYFAPPGTGGLNFYTVTPCRLVDTRNAAGALGGPILNGLGTRAFPLASSVCGLPSTASAYSLNVTVQPAGFLGYLTIYPAGQAQPGISTLNAPKGLVLANAALTPAGTNGSVNVFALNTTHVIIDTNGYFGQ